MARHRLRISWGQTAAIAAPIINILVALAGEGEPVTPDDINPMAVQGREPVRRELPKLTDLSILEKVFCGRE